MDLKQLDASKLDIKCIICGEQIVKSDKDNKILKTSLWKEQGNVDTIYINSLDGFYIIGLCDKCTKITQQKGLLIKF